MYHLEHTIITGTEDTVYYETTLEADASMAQVWTSLADVEKWPAWTESMREVRWLDGGSLKVGGRARVKQPGMPALVWEVSELEPGSSFAWRTSSAGVKTVGLHVLSAVGPDKTAITLRIEMSGALSPIVWLLTGSRSKRYVRMEADGLKRFAESPN
jgi:uncharacterized membrane protein